MALNHPSIDREVLLTSKVYRSDVCFHVNEFHEPIEDDFIIRDKKGKRSKISGYSEKSKRRYRFLLRNTSYVWSHELQMSYGCDFPYSGRTAKNHVKRFTEALQRKYPGIRWTWRIGFQQERGRKGLAYAPHIHFMSDRFVDKDWLAKTWGRIVGSIDVNHEKVSTHVEKIRSIKGMVNYMVNYMAEDKETAVPEGFKDVGRFWGIKRGIVEYEMFQNLAPYRVCSRRMRLFKRWYKAELRSWGIYKWQAREGVGFTAIGGRRLFDVLMNLKQ